MLKNRYDEILIGLNMTSLMRGLASINNQKSVLLIDDKRFRTSSLVSDFVSEIEIFSILRFAKAHNVPELTSIRKFLRPATIKLNSDRTRLQVGSSPFENLIELLRKYPDLSEKYDLDQVYSYGENAFNLYFSKEVELYESSLFDSTTRRKNLRYELSSNTPKWFKLIFNNFLTFINLEFTNDQNLKSNSLLHVMSVLFEEKMKAKLTPEEGAFYFFKLLSPHYRVQNFHLVAQLKRRLEMSGGDFKESNIQYWQFYKGRFENLLLTSFEGVIAADKVLFFTHLPDELPFSLKSDMPFYRMVELSVDKSSITAHPAHQVTLQTKESTLGTDHPFSVILSDESFGQYLMPYPDMPGSKAEFYKPQLNLMFTEDKSKIPFVSSVEKFSASLGATLDLRGPEIAKTYTQLETMPISFNFEGGPIQGFEYWGTHKYYSLGYLGLCYGISSL